MVNPYFGNYAVKQLSLKIKFNDVQVIYTEL